jgi:hypothetical protein
MEDKDAFLIQASPVKMKGKKNQKNQKNQKKDILKFLKLCSEMNRRKENLK